MKWIATAMGVAAPIEVGGNRFANYWQGGHPRHVPTVAGMGSGLQSSGKAPSARIASSGWVLSSAARPGASPGAETSSTVTLSPPP